MELYPPPTKPAEKYQCLPATLLFILGVREGGVAVWAVRTDVRHICPHGC